MRLQLISNPLFQTIDSFILSLLLIVLVSLLIFILFNTDFDSEKREKFKVFATGLLSIITLLTLKLILLDKGVWQNHTAEYVVRMGIIYQFTLPISLHLYQNSKEWIEYKRVFYFVILLSLIINLLFASLSFLLPNPLLKGGIITIAALFSAITIFLIPIIYKIKARFKYEPFYMQLSFTVDVALFLIVVVANIFAVCTLFIGRCLVSSYSLKIVLLGANMVLLTKYFLSILLQNTKHLTKGKLFSSKEGTSDEEYGGEHFTDLKERLIKYFAEEKPYLESDINIKEVATYLYTNKTYLSRLINDHFNSNFCQFVNYYRIEEAKRLFIENRKLTVQELCDMSGFGSIASFNISFRVFVGNTPAEWCREKRIELTKTTTL